MTTEHRNALAEGFLLHWYRIEAVLGRGGFGITYLATDTNLDRRVAIKEYLPVELAVREGDQSVHPHSQAHRGSYTWGLERFIGEAQTLARFEHPAIVRVHLVFEANNTAYMVMRYEQGVTLNQAIAGGRSLPPDRMLAILMPLLDGLESVHAQGFIHRDIKPANLFLRDQGGPLLIDFGSARQAFGQETHTLTAMVSPGYAPFEQYHGRADQQGPWSDIYGLGATLYRALLGKSPADALLRSEGLLSGGEDPYIPAMTLGAGRFPAHLLAAIDHALAFQPQARPQSVAQWRGELTGDEPATAAAPVRPAGAVAPGAATQPLETTRLQTGEAAAMPEPPPTPTAEMTADDYRAFVGPRKRDQYLERFRQMDADPRWWRPHWNRPAALGGPLWLAWRRRYRWLLLHPFITAGLAALLLLPLAVVAGDKTLPAALVAAAIPLTAGLLWPGLWGDRLLHGAARKAIRQADEQGLTGDERRAWLARQGGCSRRAVVLTALTGILLLLFAGGAGQLPENGPPGPAPDPATVSSGKPSPGQLGQSHPVAPTEPGAARLLAAARQDIDALRLSTPRGNNALEKIAQVLARDPDNAEALQLRRAVAGRYLELAAGAFDKEDPDAASRYLERAAQLAPDLPQLADYRRNLSAARLVRQAQQSAQAGDLNQAESQLRQAHELLPRNKEVERWLKKLRAQRKLLDAQIAFRRGRTREARKLVNEARRLYGNNREFKQFERQIKEWRKGG